MSAYILDTETTGIVDAVPVEVAWIKIDGFLGALSSFVEDFHPGKPISFGAMAVHHILDTDLLNAPSFSAFEFPADCEYLIGHNIDFDWLAIGKPNVKRICTLALARSLWPESDSHSLSAIIYFLAEPMERCEVRDQLIANAHSAYGDCRSTLSRLFVPIIKKLGLTSPIDFEALWQASEKARIPTVMPFGKYKGVPIRDIPSDYKRWAITTLELDPYLLKALS